MRSRPAVVVFFVMLALLAALQGSRFILTNDEGILLDPAQKVAAGALPYVDFFGYMSPGSYWIQAAWFRLLGVSLWAGRLPVILDFSLECALLYWLTSRLASRRTALAAVVVFAGFQIADPSFLTAQHRWDSAAIALAGICVAIRFPTRAGLFASGFLIAAAVWCTPSIALVGAALALWLCLAHERRRLVLPFAGGLLAVSAAASAVLAIQGTLGSFVRQMLWLQRNYAAVNVMPYGSVIGGYARLFDGTAGFDRILRALFVFCLALPAILPIAALLLWGGLYWRRQVPPESRPVIVLLAMATVAFAFSAFPRADLFHLAFVAAVPYALVAAALARLLSFRAGAIFAFSAIPVALLFSLNNFLAAFSSQPVPSPVGRIRVPSSIAPDVANLVARVGPGASLFVYPYLPICYFITQANNPTRFSYLAPGMMTRAEESETLAALEAHPPEWLLYMQLSHEEFLRVFPNAGKANNRFENLEDWFARSYVPFEDPGVNIAGYRLYRRHLTTEPFPAAVSRTR